MTSKRLVAALLLALPLGACSDDLLNVSPVDQISEDIAIVDEASAQAVLVGAYSALLVRTYYGGSYLMWSETLTDNVEHTGTFDSYADADLVFLRPDVGSITGIWTSMRTRSKSLLRSASTASAPSWAIVTRWPRFPSREVATTWLIRLSSASRMDACRAPAAFSRCVSARA